MTGTADSRSPQAFGAGLLQRIGGRRIHVGGHRPFPLRDPGMVWLILEGQVDLFAVEMVADDPVGQRRHVATLRRGEVLFGTGSLPVTGRHGSRLELLAVATLGTELFEGERSRIAGGDFDIVVVGWIDAWIEGLSEALGRMMAVPRDAALLEAEPAVPYDNGAWLSAQHQDVLWIEADARLQFQGEEALAVAPGSPLLPLTERTCAQLSADTSHAGPGGIGVSGFYTPTALLLDRLWPALDAFHPLVLRGFWLIEQRARAAAHELLERRRETRAERLDAAFGDLAQVLGERDRTFARPGDPRHETHTALRLVVARLGLSLKDPGSADARTGSPVDPVRAILRRSGLMSRRVLLEDGWWRKDAGPLLGFMAESGHAVALLPLGHGRYACHDPRAGTVHPVDQSLAEQLSGEAQMIYRPLPDGVVGAKALLRFGAFGLGPDLYRIVAMAVLSGLLALAVPIATGKLLVEVLPLARMDALVALLLAMGMAAIGAAAFDTTRAIALLRVEGRMDLGIQAAVWDRLLALPAVFFRRYTAGDLADRANGINTIRQVMTASVASAVMGMVSALFSFLLLFWYSWRLALIATALMAVLGGATALFGRLQMPHQRALFQMQGRLDGLVFQLLSGIAKLRVANSEMLGLARWAEGFAEQKGYTLKVRRWGAAQQVFNAAFPVLASLGLFAFIYYGLFEAEYQVSFDLAAFLSFNAAFGQLMTATVALTASITTVLAVIPLYERVSPILIAPREGTGNKVDPGELRGAVEFRSVGFRYLQGGPPVLDEVSFRIAAGEYVAFVGPSGSGKSTIYRLLLGFERPDAGSVMVDEHDLDSLDLGAVRAQMGVVLQNGRLLAGSIFENIVGSLPLTQEAAWEAARRAGLDRDIKAMPMGMHTVLPEGGIGLSGGQKQRLLIARALVRRPRILLFDEATSALDNQTQAIVQDSLERLNVTRIVIAHRLSTIRGVDRIYVVDGGRIVETGSYEELLAAGGSFARLASRQIV